MILSASMEKGPSKDVEADTGSEKFVAVQEAKDKARPAADNLPRALMQDRADTFGLIH